MILGEYPCCDGMLSIEVPDGDLPKFLKENCPHCGKTVWHKLSRVTPMSWTEEDFLKEFEVDDNTKKIIYRKSK